MELIKLSLTHISKYLEIQNFHFTKTVSFLLIFKVANVNLFFLSFWLIDKLFNDLCMAFIDFLNLKYHFSSPPIFFIFLFHHFKNPKIILMGLISGTTTSEYLIKLSLMRIPKNWQILKIYIFMKTMSYKLRLWINFANFISSDRKPILCNLIDQ